MANKKVEGGTHTGLIKPHTTTNQSKWEKTQKQHRGGDEEKLHGLRWMGEGGN